MDLFDSSLDSSLTEKVYVKEFLDSSELQVIETTTSESLIEVSESLSLLEVGAVLNTGVGTSFEKSTEVDASQPFSYLAYQDKIMRLNYTTWPPAVEVCITQQPETDWPNRTNLTYS